MKTMRYILAVTATVGMVALMANAAPRGDTPKSRYGAVDIQTTATLVFTGLLGRNSFSIQNKGPNSIYCGYDSVVTTATGTEVTTGSVLSVDLVFAGSGNQDVYCIAATANQASPANTRWMQVK